MDMCVDLVHSLLILLPLSRNCPKSDKLINQLFKCQKIKILINIKKKVIQQNFNTELNWLIFMILESLESTNFLFLHVP